MTDVDLGAGIIDVRDIIARFEELGGSILEGDEQREEYATLRSTLEELTGFGGDEQWRGDWYPLMLIRDSYFVDYARDLAEDIGAIDRDNDLWPKNHIDWTAAAEELRGDYTAIEIEGVTYWYR